MEDGTQSIGRTIELLRVVATRGRFGWGLTELAAECGLNKATTHRILSRLERERMVERTASGDHYILGPLLGELSLSVRGFNTFVDVSREYVTELARSQGLVGILSLLSGDHFVVSTRAASSRLRSELNEVGARRPLISTAGGIAIVVGLPPHEQNRIIESNLGKLPAHDEIRTREYMTMWNRSRELGYGTNFEDIAIGVNAVAVPVFDKQGSPFGSVTLSGLVAQLPVERCHALVATLNRAAEGVAQLAAETYPALYAGRAGRATTTRVNRAASIRDPAP
ncbi:IclR family transcriptional regulator [soil metagenome]